MKKAIVLLALAVLISGCATGYQKQGLMGGYTNMKLQDDIYKVGFRGNAYTRSEKAEDFTLLRCAEVALENGYKYFVTLETKSEVRTTNAWSDTSGSVSGTASNSGGFSGTYSGTTYYYAYHKPGTSATIKCFKEKPANIQAQIYDAEQVKTNIKKQYGIE